jgi:poly-gamma-glutamate synthesis protein (capsule biosynthesis protein)
VVQNYERFGDKMIFYSLGNFIFDTDYQRQRPYTQFGMLLKLNFTEKEWAWEHLPILIDRDENRIVEGENPAIFTQINAQEYDLLKDLIYADYLIVNRASRKYLNAEKYGAYTDQDWYDYDARWMGTEGADMLHQGAKRVEQGLWKRARKELIEYIGKNLPFVIKEREK